MSDRQIAKALGVSNPTVSAQRKQMKDEGTLLKINNATCSDGRTYPRKRKKQRKSVVSVFNPTKREEKAMKLP